MVATVESFREVMQNDQRRLDVRPAPPKVSPLGSYQKREGGLRMAAKKKAAKKPAAKKKTAKKKK
jgi:hypothetical protein